MEERLLVDAHRYSECHVSFYVRVMEAALVLHRLSVDLLPLSGFVSARQAPLEFATT